MMWFWEQYTRHPGERNEITASPLRASIEQLQGLPLMGVKTWTVVLLISLKTGPPICKSRW